MLVPREAREAPEILVHKGLWVHLVGQVVLELLVDLGLQVRPGDKSSKDNTSFLNLIAHTS